MATINAKTIYHNEIIRALKQSKLPVEAKLPLQVMYQKAFDIIKANGVEGIISDRLKDDDEIVGMIVHIKLNTLSKKEMTVLRKVGGVVGNSLVLTYSMLDSDHDHLPLLNEVMGLSDINKSGVTIYLDTAVRLYKEDLFFGRDKIDEYIDFNPMFRVLVRNRVFGNRLRRYVRDVTTDESIDTVYDHTSSIHKSFIKMSDNTFKMTLVHHDDNLSFDIQLTDWGVGLPTIDDLKRVTRYDDPLGNGEQMFYLYLAVTKQNFCDLVFKPNIVYPTQKEMLQSIADMVKAGTDLLLSEMIDPDDAKCHADILSFHALILKHTTLVQGKKTV